MSQGGPKPAGWSWSDELDEELARRGYELSSIVVHKDSKSIYKITELCCDLMHVILELVPPAEEGC